MANQFSLILPTSAGAPDARVIRVLVVPDEDDPYGVDVLATEENLGGLVAGRAEVVPSTGRDAHGPFTFLVFHNAEAQHTRRPANRHTRVFNIYGIRGTVVVAGYDPSTKRPISCPESIVSDVAWDFLNRNEGCLRAPRTHAWRLFESYGWS